MWFQIIYSIILYLLNQTEINNIIVIKIINNHLESKHPEYFGKHMQSFNKHQNLVPFWVFLKFRGVIC